MVAFSDIPRLKDEFILAAKVRPATAEHYVAWLEAYMDAGKRPEGLYVGAFSGFHTVSADAKLPPLPGGHAMKIIVPPGVTIDSSDKDDCQVFNAADGSCEGRNDPGVWVEMLDMLINDGYSLSRLVSDKDLKQCVLRATVHKLTDKWTGEGFYESFSKDATLQTVNDMLDKLRAMDVTAVAREFLEIKPETKIDKDAQKIIDEQGKLALKALEVLQYKLDPASNEPIPAFGKRAKKAAPAGAPKVDLEKGIQTVQRFRLKDAAEQP